MLSHMLDLHRTSPNYSCCVAFLLVYLLHSGFSVLQHLFRLFKILTVLPAGIGIGVRRHACSKDNYN